VDLKVYSLLGEELATLVSGMKPAGMNIVQWDGTGQKGNEVPSGVYLCSLRLGSRVESRKIVILR
jgi:flagellar hook assembly protein FlgD